MIFNDLKSTESRIVVSNYENDNFNLSGLHSKIIDIRGDIRDYNAIAKVIETYKPEFIFHLAAQPIVKESYKYPKLTIETNVIGTTNILESLRILNLRCNAVIITSDKCYENVEWIWGYRENDSLGGEDPYSASKGAAELVIKTYAQSFFASKQSNTKIVSARAGNVIGGGDWAQYRIIPDAMRAWSKDEKVIIRNPYSTRPWQHVLEPLSGYLLLGQTLFEKPELNGQPFNFGPNQQHDHSVLTLIEEMSKYWGKVNWKVEPDIKNEKEAGLLKLNCDKAASYLSWYPNLDFKTTIKLVMDWYVEFYTNKKKKMYDISMDQILFFEQEALKKNLVWLKK